MSSLSTLTHRPAPCAYRAFWLMLIAAMLLLASSAPALGQITSFPSEAQVSVLIQGTLSQHGYTGAYYSDTQTFTTTNPRTDPVSYSTSIGGSVGSGDTTASVSASATLHASAGLMRASISGNSRASWGSTSPFSTARVADSYVRVSWNDWYMVHGNPANPQPGRPLIVQAFLKVSGGMSADITPAESYEFASLAGAQTQLLVTARDEFNRDLLAQPAPYSGFFGREAKSTAGGGIIIHDPPPAIIPLTLLAQESSAGKMSFIIEIRGTTNTSNSSYYVPGSTAAEFSSDFGRTFSWGGITSVVDAASGEPVSGWTIESASGVNYATAIPEPHAAALLVCLSAILRRRRR